MKNHAMRHVFEMIDPDNLIDELWVFGTASGVWMEINRIEVFIENITEPQKMLVRGKIREQGLKIK